MKSYFNSTESEERMLMELVNQELIKRAVEGRYDGSTLTYGEMEEARRQAIADGAYRNGPVTALVRT